MSDDVDMNNPEIAGKIRQKRKERERKLAEEQQDDDLYVPIDKFIPLATEKIIANLPNISDKQKN